MSSVSTRPAENTTVFISFFFLRITRSKSGVDTLSGTFLDKNSLSQLCPGVCMFGPYIDFTPVCLCVCVFLLVYIDFSFLVCPCPYWTSKAPQSLFTSAIFLSIILFVEMEAQKKLEWRLTDDFYVYLCSCIYCKQDVHKLYVHWADLSVSEDTEIKR